MPAAVVETLLTDVALLRLGADAPDWGSLDLDARRAVLAQVLDHATVAPGSTGSRTFDYGRVRPRWRR